MFVWNLQIYYLLPTYKFVSNPSKVKGSYNDLSYVVTLYCFARWMFLNLKHVTLKNFILMFFNIMVEYNENNRIEKKIKKIMYIMVDWVHSQLGYIIKILHPKLS